jgi:hypothetical protein
MNFWKIPRGDEAGPKPVQVLAFLKKALHLCPSFFSTETELLELT